MTCRLVKIFVLFFACNAFADNTLSPALIGWGNLLVPGAGATFRGQPGRGLIEAAGEIGLFYGGTYGVREGDFTIDTTLITPKKGNLYPALAGLTMQELGLKFHMYDTFYHYQQATMDLERLGKTIPNPQPLYRGSLGDMLTAPFRWKNLSNPAVFGVLIAAAAYLAYDYHTTPVSQQNFKITGGEEALVGIYNIGVEPMGSAFGEEAFFRGFMQREFLSYTGSLLAALVMQTAVFATLHPAENRIAALSGGLYFGYLAYAYEGDLEPGIAGHFWVDALQGIATYFRFRRAHQEGAPFSPPIGIRFGMAI